MYTLQILDAGQTFLHSLGDQPTTFGSAEDVNVRLREAGVAPHHARLEPHADGVRLRAEADVRVNGEARREAELQLGDRVEIGKAVLVVGRTVARKAGPDDVLAGAVKRTPRRAASKPSAAPRIAAVLVVVLAVAGGLVFALGRDDSAQVSSLLAVVENLRTNGKLDEARRESARLRALWAVAEDDRLARLDAVDEAIAEIDRTRDRLRARVLDPSDTRTYAQWSRELRELEVSGQPDERVAARKVRGRLRELVRQRDERAAKQAVAAGSAGAIATTPVVGEGERVGDDGDAAAVVDQAALQVDQAEVERLCGDRQFAQALALLQAGFESAASPEEVERLRTAEASVRERAGRAMQELLAEARRAEADGRVEHAATLLQSARHRFPASIAFAAIGDELRRLEALVVEREREAALAATRDGDGSARPVDPATRLQTLASLRGHMDQVRDAEEGGDYAQAARLLREAAEAVRARDAEFADRLVVRADESDLLAGWNDAIVAAITAGKELTATDMAGREIELLRVEDGRIIARSPDGDARLEWFDVDAAGMLRLAEQVGAGGRTSLGLAALLYKNGESEAAERVLADLLRSSDKWKADVDGVLARGRGEVAGAAGYVLRKGQFVSLRQIQLEQHSKKLLGKLDAALRAKDAGKRDDFVAETLAQGELQREALGYAVRELFEKQLERVASSGLKKQVDRLTAERELLDAARAHAKALIYDEVKYFYPYKPPAVSGEKHAEYNRVQQEVDERVAALRRLWEGSRTRLKVSKKFGEELERVDWLAEQLSRLGALPKGESIATVLQPIAWARALEPDSTVTLQTFALTPSERERFAHWRRIRAYNEAAKDEWPVAVTTLLRITNDYRVMFGHRPLAAVKSACEASQGHADEMSKLGYFAHMSPTPGRKTPTDRMRLAGYMFGVSENIAMTGGALSSHVAWCHSSGHHRNLLSPSHREIGIGANGRYWVQNFGSGDVHTSHPLWAAVAEK
ncbi:MAG: hypothetical protein KAI24_24250 [Planctomycetes bacterium]|nr:hypothetical protein [Planctomycetota bacterium]